MRPKWFCRLCRVSFWVIAADLGVINAQRYHVLGKIGLKLGLKLVNLNLFSWRPLAGTNDFSE